MVMPITEALLTTEPTVGDGHLIAGSWRLVVEMLTSSRAGSLVGVAVAGTELASEVGWVDITEYVSGLSWTRGASAFGEAPQTGVLTLQLASDDPELMASINRTKSSWHGVGYHFRWGTMIRVSVMKSGSWRPQFTGLVEQWDHEVVGRNAGGITTVTLTETTSWLGLVEESDLLYGATYITLVARIEELLADTNWPFGSYLDEDLIRTGTADVYLDDYPTVQPSKWDGRNTSVLQELRDSAERHAALVYSARDGRLRMSPDKSRWVPDTATTPVTPTNADLSTQYAPDGALTLVAGTPGASEVAYAADSLRVVSDVRNIVNRVFAWNENGSLFTTQEVLDSQERFGFRDMDLHIGGAGWELEIPTEIARRRSFATFEVAGPTLFLDENDTDTLHALSLIEPGDALTLEVEVGTITSSFDVIVRSLNHRVDGLGKMTGLKWECDLTLDLYPPPGSTVPFFPQL